MRQNDFTGSVYGNAFAHFFRRRRIAGDGAFEFAGVYRLFDKHFIVPQKSVRKCDRKCLCVFRFRRSVRRARRAGLYKKRKAECTDGFFYERIVRARIEHIRSPHGNVGDDPDTRRLKDDLCFFFIHRERARRDGTADIGDVRRFEESLNRAVFAVRAVKDCERDVDVEHPAARRKGRIFHSGCDPYFSALFFRYLKRRLCVGFYAVEFGIVL